MKQFIAIFIAIFLVDSYLMAKDNQAFLKIKERKLSKLKAKKEILEKRIACIQKAKTSKEIKSCEKKYPLLKRKKSF